jgi:hypothetical protein
LTKGLTRFYCFGGGQISDECQPKLTSYSGHANLGGIIMAVAVHFASAMTLPWVVIYVLLITCGLL